jgi:alkylation response protein AidB-like acyl-CoA dehydrogenase
VIQTELSGLIPAVDRKVRENPSDLPREVLAPLNRAGFFSMWIPKFFGGRGFHPLSMQAFNEEMGAACLGIANIVGAHYVGLGLISLTFHYEILRRVVRSVRRHESGASPFLLSAAITESTAGTDLEDPVLIRRAKVHCHAKKVDGGYLLNGSKVYISNAPWAGLHVVAAYEDLAQPASSSVVLAVPADTKGVSVGTPEKKMGQHACPAAEVFFRDCFVSDDQVCLSPSQFARREDFEKFGDFFVDDLLALSRAGVGALAAGVAGRVHSELIEWLARHQTNSEWAQSEAARTLMNWKEAQLIADAAHLEHLNRGAMKDISSNAFLRVQKWTPAWVQEKTLGAGLASSRMRDSLRRRRLQTPTAEDTRVLSGHGSWAKSSASRLAMRNLRIAISMMGLTPTLEKILRDAKLLEIFEGTSALNDLNVFRQLCGPSLAGFQPFSDPEVRS